MNNANEPTGYSFGSLRDNGCEPLMLRLMVAVQQRDTVTYGEMARILENKLNISKIFPVHIGQVAEALIEKILVNFPDAPPINVAVVRNTGLPGDGAGYFLDNYKVTSKLWKSMNDFRKRQLFSRVLADIYAYDHWPDVYEKVFLKKVPSSDHILGLKERDGKSQYGGPAESFEHKTLKAYVVSNPESIGIKGGVDQSGEELALPSGDRVDAYFQQSTNYWLVEVKSIRSSDEDIRRGIFQCVKYRAVQEAALSEAVNSQVKAVLVTERQIPSALRPLAKRCNVVCHLVTVNNDHRKA